MDSAGANRVAAPLAGAAFAWLAGFVVAIGELAATILVVPPGVFDARRADFAIAALQYPKRIGRAVPDSDGGGGDAGGDDGCAGRAERGHGGEGGLTTDHTDYTDGKREEKKAAAGKEFRVAGAEGGWQWLE